jgi:conjugative relaxase-like TrwC/TraI family protein
VVLRIHVVRQGGHHYYVQDLIPGRAEGSLVAGEEPGQWLGAGSTALGLTGPVGPPEFAEVLEGRHPRSGQALRRLQGERSTAGYDLTFSAPKSVSLLHLLAPREMAVAAGTGHHTAVADALEYLGREGVGVRRSRRGQVAFLPSTGPVAGTFLHRTSRALDPHLHTHVVVANVAEGVDGVWSGVDSRRLHAHLGAAQSLYHARLRFELGHRMGAAWEVRSSGMGDVIGVEGGLRRLFSRRTAAMDEYVRRRPGPGTGATRVAAFHADRPDKDLTVTVEDLMAEWRQRASDFGFDLGDLTRAVGPHRQDPVPAVDPAGLRRTLEVLSREHRAMARQDVVAAVASSSPVGAVGREVEAVASRLWDSCGGAEGAKGAARTDRGPLGSLGPRWDAERVDRVVRSVESGRLEWPSRETAHPGSALLPPGPGRGEGPELENTVRPGHPRRPTPPTVLAPSLGVER